MQSRGIKDRFVLGAVSGLLGNAAKMAVDEVSLRWKISQRSFRATAAGVWLKNKKQADSFLGQLLGTFFDFGLGLIGGIISQNLLSKSGRDYLIVKGSVFGLTMGAIITAVLSWWPTNKLNPKGPASNLSYMASHVVYGLVTVYAASLLGHPSLYDVAPQNDYLKPTEPTTEQIRGIKKSYT